MKKVANGQKGSAIVAKWELVSGAVVDAQWQKDENSDTRTMKRDRFQSSSQPIKPKQMTQIALVLVTQIHLCSIIQTHQAILILK